MRSIVHTSRLLKYFTCPCGLGPLATAQTEVDLHLIAHVQPIEAVAAIARQLKLHELRIFRIVAQLDDELAFAKTLGDLLGFIDDVEFPGGFQSHDRTIGMCGANSQRNFTGQIHRPIHKPRRRTLRESTAEMTRGATDAG